jgi:kynureninase
MVTSSDPAQRGAQLSLRISANGRRVCDQLAEAGIICDWREPDIMRVAPVPLYNSFMDAHIFVEEFFNAIDS